jgi:hypothetical protein
MSVRTSHKTVTFTRPFSLSEFDEVQAAGTYTVQTEEELLPRLSFPAWRRWKRLRQEMPQARNSSFRGDPGGLAGSAEPSASGW